MKARMTIESNAMLISFARSTISRPHTSTDTRPSRSRCYPHSSIHPGHSPQMHHHEGICMPTDGSSACLCSLLHFPTIQCHPLIPRLILHHVVPADRSAAKWSSRNFPIDPTTASRFTLRGESKVIPCGATMLIKILICNLSVISTVPAHHPPPADGNPGPGQGLTLFTPAPSPPPQTTTTLYSLVPVM